MATSQLGNLVSTVPMALVSSWFGWRGAYGALLVATLLLAALVYALVRDAPPGHDFHARPRETLRQSASGVMEVLRIPGIWRLHGDGMVRVGHDQLHHRAMGRTVPERRTRPGYPRARQGALLDGDRRHRRRARLHPSRSLDGAYQALDRVRRRGERDAVRVLALWPRPSLATATLLLTLLGLVGGYSVLIATHGRQFYPDRLIGRGISTVNCAVLFGAASLQVLTGASFRRWRARTARSGSSPIARCSARSRLRSSSRSPVTGAARRSRRARGA